MPELISVDPQVLLEQVNSIMEEELGEILNPGDERRIVAGNIIAVVVAAMEQANAYAKGQLLRYSYGDMLDALGELVDVSRLPAEAAKVTLRFSIQAPAGTTVIIPKGTRATPDGKLFFATIREAAASYDAEAVEVDAEALEPGTAYNGLPAGSVKVIVDPVPYVGSVTSTAMTSDGMDREDDESFRERVRMAPSHFSVAGPAGAYRYLAMSANAAIGDVSVTSPAPKEVLVTVLMRDGSQPGEAVLKEVAEILSADTRRPLSDKVTVQGPDLHPYTVTASYHIAREDSTDEERIKTAVQAAYQEYFAWQGARLGRAVNPDELRRRLLVAGAYRVEVTAPEYTPVDEIKVAAASAESVLTYGGLM